MKKLNTIIIILFTCVFAYSQNTITGTFSELANQQIKLVGFNGFNTYTIDSTQANEKGSFNLSFSKQDYGMGYLLAEDGNALLVILAGNEKLILKGETPAFSTTTVFLSGKQNRLFQQYASEHSRREESLSAWDYLAEIYNKDSLFIFHEVPKQIIENEKQRIKAEDSLFLASLPDGSFVSFYLPVRNLVSSVSNIVMDKPEEIPATIHAFNTLDYSDTRLYKSGILKETIDSQFWLIENSGSSMDSKYIRMNKSIDYLIENLLTDEKKLNEIAEYLFKLLESRSLFGASEYLSLKLLNEQGCSLNKNFASRLESYRLMKKGNIAPNIELKGDVFAPGFETINIPQNLTDIKSKYTVVLFGSSWCSQCPPELMQIAGLYNKWKQNSVEVIFVSLDEDKDIFRSFVSPFPFISFCDYKKWGNTSVIDYHVFATPSIFLLDDKREILLRPNSVNHLDSWIDWFLVKGNE